MRALLRKLALAAGIAFLVLLGVLLAVLPGSAGQHPTSVFSSQSEGLRGLYLLCEALGFAAEPWDETPGALRGPGALLVLPELPTAPPAAPAGVGGLRSRDLAHYRRFVEEGGTLLVLDADADALDFLRDELGFVELAGLESNAFGPHGREGKTVRVGAERLELDEAPASSFESRAPPDVLARGSHEEPVVVAGPVGAGRVVLAGLGLDALDNRALSRSPGGGVLFVRLLEALAPERILFDEYALGDWQPRSAAALAFAGGLAWPSAHLLLLLLVVVWRSAWTGPFPRDPEPVLAASPLGRARGFGRLLARAGRFDLLADLLRRGLRARWEGRAGRATASDTDSASGLRALARGDGRLSARLQAAFARVPSDEGELAELERELRSIEARLFPRADAKTRPGPGQRARATRS